MDRLAHRPRNGRPRDTGDADAFVTDEDVCRECGDLLWRDADEAWCEWCRFYGIDVDEDEDAT